MALMYKGIYNLKNLFIKGKDFMDGREIVNNFDYQSVFDYYCDKLEKEQFDGLKLILKEGSYKYQYYERLINLPNSSFYRVQLSIQVLKNIIEYNNIPKMQLSVKELYPSVDLDNIDPIRLKIASQNNKPIIVGVVQFLSPDMIIFDGNHRVCDRYLRGIDKIDAYLLSPGIFVDAINSEYIKMVLMMQFNLWLIDVYMIGLCTRQEFDNGLFSI